MIEAKVCTSCGEKKPISSFYKRSETSYRSQCKDCMIKIRTAWQKDNKDKVNAYHKEQRKLKPHLEKNRRLKYRFGITLEDFNAMLEEQNNKCLICDTSFDNQSACVDHCHTTGGVRGLLCTACNQGLGQFKDNVDNLTKAIDYILTTRKAHGKST